MTAQREPIRVDDLRQPVLTEAARQALDEAERDPAVLTEEAVLSAARRATGLTDFGPDTFREGLRRTLDDVANNPNATRFGQAETFRSCVYYVSIRLRLQDLLKRHPQIVDLPFREPIIVVGPWRSGTTHMHGLLGADSRLRTLRYRELVEPLSSYVPGEDDVVVLPHVRCDLLPYLAAMHPLGHDDVAEEITLQGANFPAESDGDHRPHFEYMKTILKAMQWQHGPDRWVLKSPSYCEQLPVLMDTFPDATVVMLHRDPVATVQSLATRFAYARRLRDRQVNPDAILAACVDRVEYMLRARMRDEHLVPAARRVEILFHDFMADQSAALHQVYAAAGLELTDEQQKRIAAFRTDHARYRHGRIVYDLREDFGVDPAEIRERFGFYYDQYPVRVEVG